jgi:hypothetical protein
MEQIDFETVAGPSTLGTGSGTDHDDVSIRARPTYKYVLRLTPPLLSLITCHRWEGLLNDPLRRDKRWRDGSRKWVCGSESRRYGGRDAIEGNISRCTTREWPICSHQRIGYFIRCLWLFAVCNVIGGLKSKDVLARTPHPKCALLCYMRFPLTPLAFSFQIAHHLIWNLD